jgi:hypothetical protein
MLEKEYEEYITHLDEQNKRLSEAHTDMTKACIEYLKIVETYSRLIHRAGNLKEAKDWADRMIDHALKVM